jgi:hypothetical protein
LRKKKKATLGKACILQLREVMVEDGVRRSTPSSFEASKNSIQQGEAGSSCIMDEGESKSEWESFVLCDRALHGRASEVKETWYDM